MNKKQALWIGGKMNKKEIEKRLLIFTGEIDIEDIKKDFINDEVNEDVFNRCLKLYYAIDDAIYNNKRSLFEALIYLINKDRENKDHKEPIITDYDLVYLTLNNYINLYEMKRLFLLQKNINDFDFKSMMSKIEKIKVEVENGK
ncbi:hypothetical protein AAHV66_28115 (plasmid) [Klebsiella pneumoniae]|uniref:hypothetical protein n=1 Tax=Escherichia coli TaxID=562 RepID=UPI001C494615|nr:hypothetical protein [Escherichia coli]EDB9947349.1 hypothetical protein [Salmonella enterica subsp. enterica serovar Muenchen]EDQ5935810.1 hypothetical protein [Salmonella enterica subsp. enterica serovar Emek]EHT9764860.1 hypothetical protein [Salmonella enterica subsp. enterica serovar Orion]HBQ2228888.1 hypothetical protein [Klebsiella pneumoniae]HCT5532787.1 hypothetical protein [Enterobacter cloacae]